MDRRSLATAVLIWPIILALALPAYLLLTGRVTDGEAGSLVAFAVGPSIAIWGRATDTSALIWTGFALYVITIAFWGFSWGAIHLWLGLPAFIASLLLCRPQHKSKAGPLPDQ